ncbi:MAG: TraB/GumN family protein [Psychroflexus sp.]|nr:TraB/GumN family protein [Psychroflexus sp.]MDR9449163.1 TraB/GumN family protein [Psychroflexus sp.]
MKFYRLILVFFLSINCVFGQPASENAMLWEVTKKEQSGYIYGTIHISCDADLSEQVIQALDQSNQLVLEVDLSDPTLQMKMMQKMILPNQKSAADYLTDKEYDLLKNYINQNVEMIPGFSLVKSLKPIFLSGLITQSLLTCSSQEGYDKLLMQHAQQREISVTGLETIEEQIDVLDQIPVQKVYDEIIESIKDDQKEDRKMIYEMIRHYKNADLQALKKLLSDADSVINDFSDVALDQRNNKWIPKIKNQLSENKPFIGFGAAHLVGENGVIELLRKEGYSVEPVN